MSDDFAARLQKRIQEEQDAITQESEEAEDRASLSREKKKQDRQAAIQIDQEVVQPAFRVLADKLRHFGPSIATDSVDDRRETRCGLMTQRGRVNICASTEADQGVATVALEATAYRGTMASTGGSGSQIQRHVERFDLADITNAQAWLESKLIDAAVGVVRFAAG